MELYTINLRWDSVIYHSWQALDGSSFVGILHIIWCDCEYKVITAAIREPSQIHIRTGWLEASFVVPWPAACCCCYKVNPHAQERPRYGVWRSTYHQWVCVFGTGGLLFWETDLIIQCLGERVSESTRMVCIHSSAFTLTLNSVILDQYRKWHLLCARLVSIDRWVRRRLRYPRVL